MKKVSTPVDLVNQHDMVLKPSARYAGTNLMFFLTKASGKEASSSHSVIMESIRDGPAGTPPPTVLNQLIDTLFRVEIRTLSNFPGQLDFVSRTLQLERVDLRFLGSAPFGDPYLQGVTLPFVRCQLAKL
jgi:hypothetical protein